MECIDVGKPAGMQINLEACRVPQDLQSALCAERVFTTVETHRPNKQQFVRVRPEEKWQFPAAVIEFKLTNETYLVEGHLVGDLRQEVVIKLLRVAIGRDGNPFIWPIRLPEPDGKLDSWNASALQAAKIAETSWVRLIPSKAIGAYEVMRATVDFGEPEWPSLSFQQIIDIAFRGKVISTLEDPVVLKLRGLL
jgi:hypothetical protein